MVRSHSELRFGYFCVNISHFRPHYQHLPNQYTLRSRNPFILAGLPQTVTFTTQSNLPLPNPRYLALHAACAKVAHLSGGGEYIDTVDRDRDTTRVLARDGSSARILADAMTRIGIMA